MWGLLAVVGHYMLFVLNAGPSLLISVKVDHVVSYDQPTSSRVGLVATA